MMTGTTILQILAAFSFRHIEYSVAIVILLFVIGIIVSLTQQNKKKKRNKNQ